MNPVHRKVRFLAHRDLESSLVIQNPRLVLYPSQAKRRLDAKNQVSELKAWAEMWHVLMGKKEGGPETPP